MVSFFNALNNRKAILTTKVFLIVYLNLIRLKFRFPSLWNKETYVELNSYEGDPKFGPVEIQSVAS